MDILSRISDFFSNIYDAAYCYFQPEEPVCRPSEMEASADRFEPVKPIEARRIEDLVRESQPVRVGCYIEMHEIREVRIEELRQLPRGLPHPR